MSCIDDLHAGECDEIVSNATVGTWTFFRLVVCSQPIKAKFMLLYNLFLLL